MARKKEQKAQATAKAATAASQIGHKFNWGELVRDILHGRLFLSLDFFTRNWLYVALFTFLLLALQAVKYDTQNQMTKLKQAKVDLNNAKTDLVDASARYNSSIRESQMVKLMDSLHIGLAAPDQPPYRLYENN